MSMPGLALAAALRGPKLDAPARTPILLVGAGGHLGAALLERLLARSGEAGVEVCTVRPLGAAPRGLRPVEIGTPADLARTACTGARDALVVFDRERRVNGRDDAFWRPTIAELPALGAALHAAGVRRLTVVTPWNSVTTPRALQAGLADRGEQALAAQGFEQLALVRPADLAVLTGSVSWPQRVADAWLRQLRWMLPASMQPVRPARLADVIAEIVLRMPGAARSGTRVLEPQALWQAARERDPAVLIDRWLRGEALPEPHLPRGRM